MAVDQNTVVSSSALGSKGYDDQGSGKCATSAPTLRKLPERIPGGGWRKVQMKAGMALKPSDNLGMFVSGVVVADDVDIKLSGDLPVDLAQEGQPLLMAMTRGGMSKDLAREIVEGRKQGHRSVTVVIMGLGADMTLAQGQTGLTALEGLTLALLIATEQEGTIRRIEIEANDIPEFLFKGQILGKFEALESMGSNGSEPTTSVERSICSSRFPAPSCARSRLLRQEPVEQPDSRPSGWP